MLKPAGPGQSTRSSPRWRPRSSPGWVWPARTSGSSAASTAGSPARVRTRRSCRCPTAVIDDAAIAQMVEDFHDVYELRNGNRVQLLAVQAVTYRVQAVVAAEKVRYPKIERRPAGAGPTFVPKVFHHLADTPVEGVEVRREDAAGRRRRDRPGRRARGPLHDVRPHRPPSRRGRPRRVRHLLNAEAAMTTVENPPISRLRDLDADQFAARYGCDQFTAGRAVEPLPLRGRQHGDPHPARRLLADRPDRRPGGHAVRPAGARVTPCRR